MDRNAALSQRSKVEQFQRKHRVGLLTLLFTDIVGSTKLKQDLGDRRAVELIQLHHQKVREILSRFSEGEEISTAGDSFFIVFIKPSDAVQFSLLLQARLRQLARETQYPVYDRIGIHVGEVFIEEKHDTTEVNDLYGIQVDTCARVMSLGQSDQILMSRFAFDNARQVLKGQDLEGLAPLSWLNHGTYTAKGVEEPVEICEVGEQGKAVLSPPPDSEKAKRQVAIGAEPVLGWRPAVGQMVPNTKWLLEKKLGEGGFGEVWLGRHTALKERRVFKFCFQADRVRSLKREVTLFKLLKEKVGEHTNIVGIREVYFEEPPYYLIMDYADGADLRAWCKAQGGPDKVPQAVRLEIVAQVADGLQAAHESGIIHRDIKPSNILIVEDRSKPASGELPKLQVKLTDFGVGQVVSLEVLAGMTQLGFTQTLIGSGSGSQTGTQLYMAPELMAGSKASVRSDIYSLGVVLYQLLAGDLARPVTTDWAKGIADPLLREDLEHCFAGKPEERFASVAQLAANLRNLSERQKRLAQQQAEILAREKAAYRRGLLRAAAAAAAVVIAFALLAIYAFNSADRAEKQKKLAEIQRKEADAARAEAVDKSIRLQDSLNLLQIRTAEGALQAHDHAAGLANLAQVLRTDPANRVAAERIMSVLFQREIAPPVTTPFNPSGRWSSAQFSPDGLRVVTASEDKTARVWDARTGQPMTAPLKHEGIVESAQFSPDGLRVVTVSGDKTARVWDARTGQPMTEPLKHEGIVESAQFSPDGLRVVTASRDKTAWVWDVRTGQPLTEPLKHEGVVRSAQFSPDGQWVVTASVDKTARVWDVRTGQPLTAPLKHEDAVRSAQFSPDGLRVVTASFDKTARVWDTRTGQHLTEPLKHEDWVNSAQFSPDGLRVVTASADKTARVWDARTGLPLTAPLKHEDAVRSAQFSPDSLRVVTASWDKTARVWDARTGQPMTEPLKHEDWVNSAQFSPDGLRVVTVSGDKTARVWDARTGQPMTEPLKHEDWVNSAQFSPDGQRVVTASGDKTARVWDARTGQPLIEPLKHESIVESAQFSPDGLRVVTASEDKTARVWDARTGQPLTAPLKHENSVYSAQFSPDGLRVVTASRDKTAWVWDVRTGQPLTAPLKHEGVVRSAQFSPDGQWVVTASVDKTARVWDVRTGQPLTAPLKHEDGLFSAQFSPDGQRVVTASADKTARVWDARTGQPLTEPLKHEHMVFSAQFSPDGLRVVTASGDKTARVWDARTGQPVTEPLKHEDAVRSAQFSPDGQRVVTMSGIMVRVWNARTGQPLTEPLQHEGGVWSAQFSPDGLRVVTASGDKTARVWELPFYPPPTPSWLADLAEAVAGERFNDRKIEPVNGYAYFDLKKRIEKDPSTNAYIVWAKWFFADRSTRTISPFSTITIPEHIRSLIARGTVSDLREAVKISPTNSLALARLAILVLAQDPKENTNRIQEAASYCFAASHWTPDLEDVWVAKARLYREMGPSEEALEFIHKATGRFPQEPGIWESHGRLMAATNRWEEAVQAYTKAIELTTSVTNGISTLRKTAFEGRAEAYRGLGETNKATTDLEASKGNHH